MEDWAPKGAANPGTMGAGRGGQFREAGPGCNPREEGRQHSTPIIEKNIIQSKVFNVFGVVFFPSY